VFSTIKVRYSNLQRLGYEGVDSGVRSYSWARERRPQCRQAEAAHSPEKEISDNMGSVQPPHKGDYTMALAKDKAKLAVAAVKSEDTQVKLKSFIIMIFVGLLTCRPPLCRALCWGCQ
jgi:hypothetical protein